MKNILKYALLTLFGAAAFNMTSYADVDPSEVVKLNKQIIPVNPDLGQYKIRLETYVTGSSVTHTEQVAVPIDLVLVLDVSSSMTSHSVPGDYTARTSQGYTYQGYGNNKYYYFDQTTNAYYQVSRGSQSSNTHYYRLYYDNGNTRYYLSGTGTTTTAPEDVTTNNGTIWTGVLYKGKEHTQQTSKAYNYNGFPRDNAGANERLYYKVGNNYYRVYREDSVKTTYYLSYKINNTTYYLSGSGSTTTQPTNVTSESTTIWTGVLYSSTSITRLQALKNACNAFIDKVAENTEGEDGVLGTDDDVQNRISIVSFGRHEKYVTGTTDPETHSTIDGDLDPDGYENNFVPVYGDGAAANIELLKNHVTNLSTLSGTRQDRGILGATNVLDAIEAERFAKSSKVVVVFTDGEPYASSENLGDGVTTSAQARNKACAYAYTLKSGNNSSGVPYKAKVFTVSMGEVTGANGDMMQYVSSNFPTVTGMNTTTNAPIPAGAQAVPGANFSFTTESGSNLTSIFEAIAESSTEGGETYPLDKESTTVVDVVSNNFVIPEGTKPADVDVWVETYWRDDAGVPHWADKTDTEHFYYSDGTIPVPVIDGNTLSINGFDFAKQDAKDSKDRPVFGSGNWVGPREFEDEEGNTETKYWGNRLVIEFPIKVNPDYEGGYAMPSNDIESGLYVNGTKILEYPVPTVDFPSICIMKDGLKVGESALFEVTGPNNLKYTVRLTQNGTDPCYVILKRLNGGEYTVKETSWSWMYSAKTGTLTEIKQNVIGADALGLTVEDFLSEDSTAEEIDLDGVTVGMKINHTATVDSKSYTGTFCVLKNKEGDYTVDELKGCAISLLYYFANTRVTTDKPARAEAFAHNEFKGGNTGGGTETGGNEEEDI